MQPRKPNTAPGDPPKDPEMLRWFQALDPPPTRQAPPDLRAKVRTRIEQQRARGGLFAWVPSLATPIWATALAAGLVLSVGLNVWWGVRGFGPGVPGAPQGVHVRHDDSGAAGGLSTYRFQVSLQHAQEIGSIIAAHPVGPAPTAAIGFTPQAARTAFFRIGTLYAEAVAALHGGAGEAATQRLDVLGQTLTTVQAPDSLIKYLHGMQTLLQSQRYSGEELAMFVALFKPLYEDEYTRSHVTESVSLFRASIWVANMSLAAAAREPVALRQEGQAVAEVHRTLTTVRAPQEVVATLEQIRSLVSKPRLTDEDVKTIGALVQRIQGLLSA